MSIMPTIGRIVYYYACKEAPEQAAMICRVADEGMVHLTVFGHDGSTVPMMHVPLIQPGEEIPGDGHCRWMPYQVKKQTGSESGEPAAGKQAI